MSPSRNKHYILHNPELTQNKCDTHTIYNTIYIIIFQNTIVCSVISCSHSVIFIIIIIILCYSPSTRPAITAIETIPTKYQLLAGSTQYKCIIIFIIITIRMLIYNFNDFFTKLIMFCFHPFLWKLETSAVGI